MQKIKSDRPTGHRYTALDRSTGRPAGLKSVPVPVPSLFSIIIDGITLDNLLTTKFSRVTHSYFSNASSVSTLDGGGENVAICKDRNRLHAEPNNNHSWLQWMISLCVVIIVIIITMALSVK